jgi:1-acyl-sn-glycerol-3-phosphate acyltransferase
MSLAVFIRTSLYLGTLLLIMLIGALPVAIIACLPRRWQAACKPLYWLGHGMYWLLIKSWRVPVVFHGQENIPQQPVIFAANHQSSLDIPLLGMLAQAKPHTWMAWYALAKYPLFGFILSRMCIVVDTRSPRRAIQVLNQACQLLQDTDQHLMIFPEGGRFTDDIVHDFFLGFAILAKKTARAVVPVLLVNTARVCYPKTLWLHYARVEVWVGKPFVYEEGESEEAFCQRVHAWFVEKSSSRS